MGKKSLNPWVADCVWHELAAVTTWKQETITGIKPDPESRFEDDGSNFRSRVSGQEQCLVQLIEVRPAPTNLDSKKLLNPRTGLGCSRACQSDPV